MSIPFDNSYVRLPERFFAAAEPAAVPGAQRIRTNAALAEGLGIAGSWLESEEALAVFAGNAIPDGAEPIAQAYAGHQFGGFSPQLGDGRAHLLGEVIDLGGVRRDIQLKGSGRTPFSRRGDGKSALGPVLREYIVSEAMHALGVPTTRALAAVTTGETVLRQEGHIPGGVFTRVASSHIRVGTFQYFLARNDTEALRLLADHTIGRHYPDAAQSTTPYLGLLNAVIDAQAKLVAHWMSLGFIHGVMNTDNVAISGETIDYGPCAFMDTFHPKCVFSAIDTGGRYAWSNQPDICLWNLTRFAETLLPIIADDQEKASELAEEALKGFEQRFQSQYFARFRAKFGIRSDAAEPMAVVHSGLELLASEEIDFTLFFHRLSHCPNDLGDLFKDRTALDSWLGDWRRATDDRPDRTAMQAANPLLIPRNHRIEQAIQAAYREEDFAPFHRLVDALAEPFEEREDYRDLQAAPLPDEVVRQTFCGT